MRNGFTRYLTGFLDDDGNLLTHSKGPESFEDEKVEVGRSATRKCGMNITKTKLAEKPVLTDSILRRR